MNVTKNNISRLQYITQGKTFEEIRSEIDEVIKSGITWIQLRVKDKPEEFEDLACDVAGKCKENDVIFILNDEVELARRINADGVHLGQTDTPVDEARKILGPKKIIGGTANKLEECLNLELAGADYIGLGPFAMTETKQNLSPILGLSGIQKISPKTVPYGWSMMSLSRPVLAIGGIQMADIAVLRQETGVHGVAVSSLIAKASDKKKLIQQINMRLYG